MRTTEEIYRALTGHIAQASGAVVAEGGDMSLRLWAVAAELFGLEAQADFVARQSLPQTAVGEYLDRHAEVRGLQRAAARKAVGQLRFSVSVAAAAARSVPAGTECRTAAGVAFVTTEAGVIPAGGTDCTVAAEAVVPGVGGNAPAGAVTMMVLPPIGIEQVRNETGFTGGSDSESDEALRERVLASYRRLPNGANAAYYESRVLAYPGAAAVEVLPRNRGVGTVDVIFAMQNGVPSAAQIGAVQALLEAEREISVDIQVKAPTTYSVNVTARLTVAAGQDYAAVAEAVRAALTDFFSGELLAKPVYKARLQAIIMGVEGVENCTLTAPGSDLAAVSGRLPVLGSVNLSEVV